MQEKQKDITKSVKDSPMVTIFKDIFSSEPHYVTVDYALERIRTGKSKARISEIRATIDKEKANVLKNSLPSVCFSGVFPERKDIFLEEHSGFLVIDFDEVGVDELPEKKKDLVAHPFVYACWVSPRGNGLKALVKLADKSRHRDHFLALREMFPEIDKSGINESRVCFESYDPDIYINHNATVFKKLKVVEKIEQFESITNDEQIFQRLLIWISNKNNAFVKGERNLFIFKIASACCRFGIDELSATKLCSTEFLTQDSTFTRSECERTIRSAYKANKSKFGSAVFDRDSLVDKVSRSEVEIEADIYNPDIKPRDVIYAEDVKDKGLDLYRNGYESVSGVGSEMLDRHFKLKRGELTLLSGIGNYGKSQFMKWYLLLHAVLYDRKFAIFPPEDNPAEEFYQDLVDILLASDATGQNPFKPTEPEYIAAWDFVGKHFFYIYPKDLSPTPEYMKERFLELIIKEKVDGCVVDPYNQMTNDYGTVGGREDKYLESVLGDFDRFAVANNVYFWIIAHPKSLSKQSNGGYPCPDVFDLSGGAMWNNKMYNILIYHRPNHHLDPKDPVAEIHTKKIKRQKVVGMKGTLQMEYFAGQRRFFIEKCDVLKDAMSRVGLSFDSLPDAPF